MDTITLTRINEGSRWGIARAGGAPGNGSILFSATVNPDAHKGKIVQEISRAALAARVR